MLCVRHVLAGARTAAGRWVDTAPTELHACTGPMRCASLHGPAAMRTDQALAAPHADSAGAIAPCSSSHSTTSVCPRAAASMSGVHRLKLTRLTRRLMASVALGPTLSSVCRAGKGGVYQHAASQACGRAWHAGPGACARPHDAHAGGPACPTEPVHAACRPPCFPIRAHAAACARPCGASRAYVHLVRLLRVLWRLVRRRHDACHRLEHAQLPGLGGLVPYRVAAGEGAPVYERQVVVQVLVHLWHRAVLDGLEQQPPLCRHAARRVHRAHGARAAARGAQGRAGEGRAVAARGASPVGTGTAKRSGSASGSTAQHLGPNGPRQPLLPATAIQVQPLSAIGWRARGNERIKTRALA